MSSSSRLESLPGYGRKTLLCPPAHFDVQYAINPQMKITRESGIAIDKNRAFEQWMLLTYFLKALGARLLYIMPKAECPDMVFTANAGFLYKERLVLSRFKHEERRVEEAHFLRYFSGTLGMPTVSLPLPLSFEGQGDMLWHGDTLLSGHGLRSGKEGVAAAIKETEYTGASILLELVDENFYHLDTCFCSLGKDILWYPPAFSEKARATVRDIRGAGKSVEVGEEDAKRFVCNGIYFENNGRRALITSPMSASLRAALNKLNIVIYENAIDEFMKAGGGNKCLIFFLN